MIMWQKCPVCGGQGNVYGKTLTNPTEHSEICKTCNGAGIISVFDGSPPILTACVSNNSGTLKKCVGFRLKIKYPGCDKEIGDFEPLETGERFNYPEIWEPVYKDE